MPPPNLRPLMGWRVTGLTGPVDLTCKAAAACILDTDIVHIAERTIGVHAANSRKQQVRQFSCRLIHAGLWVLERAVNAGGGGGGGGGRAEGGDLGCVEPCDTEGAAV